MRERLGMNRKRNELCLSQLMVKMGHGMNSVINSTHRFRKESKKKEYDLCCMQDKLGHGDSGRKMSKEIGS